VQQSVFLDIRELPALLQRMYDRTLGNKDATANILNSVDGTRVADHGAKATVTDQVYLDVAIGEQALVPKRIVLGLYHDVAPKTCDNFETLCMGHTTLTTAQKKTQTGRETTVLRPVTVPPHYPQFYDSRG
jgi:hypothetical protein